MIEWISMEERCPKCDTALEEACDGEWQVAERCNRCKWQINFANDGQPKIVKYGTKPSRLVFLQK